MKKWKGVLIGLASAVIFSILYLTPVFNNLEYRLYDFFLRFRAERPHLEDVVFLDVDDSAISFLGIFPWPRSVYADGLLRLKEFGARSIIFDIEFIDKGQRGVNIHLLEHRLDSFFHNSFSDINDYTQEIISRIRTGMIRPEYVDDSVESLSRFIDGSRDDLLRMARRIARDDDDYFSRGIALNGNVWSTLNLRTSLLRDEEADRHLIAEKHFTISVDAAANETLKRDFIDVLPAMTILSEKAKGAGFTNAFVDDDGVRRRVYLVQNVMDHWYPQLAFAPLLDYLGSPEIILEKRKLTLKQALMPAGKKDIVIPLDQHGRMMLAWPKENYFQKYKHITYADIVSLDEIEKDLQSFCIDLLSMEYYFDIFFGQFDPSLRIISFRLNHLWNIFNEANEAKEYAIENICNESFYEYLEYRNYALELFEQILALDVKAKISELSEWMMEEFPFIAEDVENIAWIVLTLIDKIEINLDDHKILTERNSIALNDKFVIIGRSDTGTTDFGRNPFHGRYINVGTHGVVLDTILSESFIIPLNFWWSILLMIVFVPIFFYFSANLRPAIRASCGIGAVFVIMAGTILLFRFSGIFLGPLGVTLSMIITIIINEIIAYVNSEKEKRFIRNAFSTYVSSDIVKEIIADPSRLQLGGTKHYMTAVFTDVKGFSTISEKLGDPAKLVSLLNKYLSAMSDVVLAEKGTIDKYIGDAIVAFFGAPIPLEDHAFRACVSAIAMKKIEREMNKEIMEQGLSPIPLLTRIGINTGYMVAGNMGTANKMNYTIMGNAVNLSARLEGVNSQYGTWILASEQTVRETKGLILYRKLDRVRVVGINEPVRLCELIDLSADASEQQKKLVRVFHQALDCFEKRRWKQAVEGFREVLKIKPDDTLSIIYLDRLKQFSVSLPDVSWDGVYNLTSK